MDGFGVHAGGAAGTNGLFLAVRSRENEDGDPPASVPPVHPAADS
jgi:hypothetical protein